MSIFICKICIKVYYVNFSKSIYKLQVIFVVVGMTMMIVTKRSELIKSIHVRAVQCLSCSIYSM